MNDNITKDYIQYSKRVTRWGIIMVTIAFILCLVSITFFTSQIEAISTIAKIYTAYITIMGVTIGAYQGNSSLEKWTKAKYQFEEVVKEDNNQ